MSKDLELQINHDRFCDAMAKGAVHMIVSRTEDNVTRHSLHVNFIARFIGAYVYQALMQKPEKPCSKDDLLKFTRENFKASKQAIQDAVSAAFTGAMNTFSGKTVEYYCQVKVVPEVKGKVC